jgi:hypothetical protein
MRIGVLTMPKHTFSKPSHSCVMVVTIVTATSLAANLASAQSVSDTERGRFAFSPVADGVLRLDTRNGSISVCSGKDINLICRSVPDERAALDAEIGRLQVENRKLKDQLTRQDSHDSIVTGKIDAPLAKENKKSVQAFPGDKVSPDMKATDEARVTQQPPIERGTVVTFVDTVWQRLVEMVTRMQKSLSDKA